MKCRIASREPACRRWTASRDREDAARRPETLQAVFQFAAAQGDQAEQGAHGSPVGRGHARHRAQHHGSLEPGRGLGEPPLVHLEESEGHPGSDGLDGLLAGRRRIEHQAIGPLPPGRHPSRVSPQDGPRQLLQRALVPDRAGELHGRRGNAAIEHQAVDEDAPRCPGADSDPGRSRGRSWLPESRPPGRRGPPGEVAATISIS